MDGWNLRSFPFGALNGLFSGANLLLVSGSVRILEVILRIPWFLTAFLRTEYTPTFRGFESFYGYYDTWWNYRQALPVFFFMFYFEKRTFEGTTQIGF